MNRMTSMLTGLTLAVLSLAGLAHARNGGGATLQANIPFEFTVGHLSFPAGQYEFTGSESDLVEIRDARGHSQFTLAAASKQGNGIPRKSTLTFVVVDGRHVLVQTWNDTAANGNEFRDLHSSVELTGQEAVTGGR